MTNGSISLAEIEALPFVNSREEALAVLSRLSRLFDVEERLEGSPDGNLRTTPKISLRRSAYFPPS